jgi:hypothetical protein
MKKIMAMLLCMTVCGAALFAQEEKKPKSLFSVGGGLALMPNFQSMKIKGSSETSDSSGFGGGINVFFDAKYAEANIGLIFANEKTEGQDKGIDSTNLLIGVIGKYPIAIAEKFALFPFIGFDYRINLAASQDGNEIKDEGGFKKADYFNALSLLFGIGVDYDITNALYFRGELGFGITFNTKYEDDIKEAIDSNFKGKIPVKLALGYRL